MVGATADPIVTGMIVAMVVGFDGIMVVVAGTMVSGIVVAIMPLVIEVEAGAAIIEVEAGAATIEIEEGSMEFRSWPFITAVRLTIPKAWAVGASGIKSMHTELMQ